MTAIEVRFHAIPKGAGREQRHAALLEEPTLRLSSSADFQLRNALDDFGLHLARHHEPLCGRRHEARLQWEQHPLGAAPQLVLEVPGQAPITKTYPVSALRANELLTPARIAGALSCIHQDGAVLNKESVDWWYVTGPAEEQETGADTSPFDLVAAEPAGSLCVQVPEVQVATTPPLHDAVCIGPDHGALPAVCPRSLLERLVREEAARPLPFAESGHYLVGRVVRDLAHRDLVLSIEDAIALPAAEASASMLVFSAESRVELASTLERRASETGQPQRLVGWQHTHDLGALLAGAEVETEQQRAQPSAVDAENADPARPQPVRGRGLFFSAQDVSCHRSMGAIAIALVLDAEAARQVAALDSPLPLERCIAVFGSVDGVVTERSLHLI